MPTLSTRPPGLADDARRLRGAVHAFVRAFGLLAADRTPCGKPLPVSHAHALLFLLDAGRRGAAPTQQGLGRTLRIDKSNVARLCAKMEAEGHLERRTAEDDARAHALRLTAAGRRLAQQVDTASRDRFDRLLAATPASLRGSASALLEALAEAAASLDPPLDPEDPR